MSTNGTRLNGKRLPRPPFKHPMDARVRIFHGDELVLAITPDGEELGFADASAWSRVPSKPCVSKAEGDPKPNEGAPCFLMTHKPVARHKKGR
ncbi:unnamed protein product [Effrenium voratum]|uniref:FHA domain-containing protein n=1 Tax=Effrenium voratum TaxID=2562239 RepID=A0AA36IU65_9DINO|nr:unnamed protein product [Effrenium voratum]